MSSQVKAEAVVRCQLKMLPHNNKIVHVAYALVVVPIF